ncbi:seipin-2 [Arachis hypogaea]|uniref:seipin-2 n=1 Tax=Arachis hypogaea TaxID=3818 RepID=UPI000DEDDCCF|nr:seipin-2 [Arachis hypogaea]
MDSPASSIHKNDAVRLNHCSSSSSNAVFHNAEEPSTSNSTVSDPQPLSSQPPISHPQRPSPAARIRRRKINRDSQGKEPEISAPDSFLTSESSDFTNGAKSSSRNHRGPRTSTKEEESPAEKCDSNEAKRQRARAVQASSSVKEENNVNNEESTVTTASKDDSPGDSAESPIQHGNSSSSFLEIVAGLVIKAIAFEIKLVTMFVTYPLLFAFQCCMFCVDPLGTTKKGKAFVTGVLARVRDAVYGRVGHYFKGWFNENDSVWSLALRCGWGLLWSIYVCCVLFRLLVNSFVVSGLLMKCFVEKPIRTREVLNFDFTKHSPVAYVPIISCDAVFGGKYSENLNNDVGVTSTKWRGQRFIPYKHKVQVTLLLTVPESGYNRDLGVFQARVDFLSADGRTMASSSKPCMLRFSSEPIRLIMTFLKIAPLVTGYMAETQTLNVHMRGFIEGNEPTSCLKVTLEQRAEYQPGAGIPQIYDASVVIESQLPFFKRIIWVWKMSIFIWITMMVFIIQLLFVLVCCRPVIIPRTRQRVSRPATQNNHQVQNLARHPKF